MRLSYVTYSESDNYMNKAKNTSHKPYRRNYMVMGVSGKRLVTFIVQDSPVAEQGCLPPGAKYIWAALLV